MNNNVPSYNEDKYNDKALMTKFFELRKHINVPIILNGRNREEEKNELLSMLGHYHYLDFKDIITENLTESFMAPHINFPIIYLKNIEYGQEDKILEALMVISSSEFRDNKGALCIISIDDLSEFSKRQGPINKYLKDSIIINVGLNNIESWIIDNLHPFLASELLSNEYKFTFTNVSKEKMLLASNILEETNDIGLLKPILDRLFFRNLVYYQRNLLSSVTLSKIINRNYENVVDIKDSVFSPIQYIYYLSLVSEEDLEVVRNYVVEYSRCVKKEYLLEYFDIFWTKQNPDKKETLESLKSTNNIVRTIIKNE